MSRQISGTNRGEGAGHRVDASKDGADGSPESAPKSPIESRLPSLAAAFLGLASFFTGGCANPSGHGPHGRGPGVGERAVSLEGMTFEAIVATKLGGASLEDQRVHGRGFISREGVAAAQELGKLWDRQQHSITMPSPEVLSRRLVETAESTLEVLTAEHEGVLKLLVRAEAEGFPSEVLGRLTERSLIMTEALQRFKHDDTFLNQMVQGSDLQYSDFVAELHRTRPQIK